MALAQNLLNQNAGRPKSTTDFDIRPGFYYLVPGRKTTHQSVWVRSMWVNFAFWLLAVALTFAGYELHAKHIVGWTEFVSFPVWKQVLVGIGTFVWATVWYSSVIGSFNCCKLVIDKANSELRFTNGVYTWQRYTLKFQDIRALKNRLVTNTRTLDDGPAVPVRIVFAELYSGELVFIAGDPNIKTASLFRDIEAAVKHAHEAAGASEVEVAGKQQGTRKQLELLGSGLTLSQSR